MIIQIDDKYFNPDQITVIVQSDSDVRVFQSDTVEAYLVFKNWKIQDLATEINRCIEEFHIDNFHKALDRFTTIRGFYGNAKEIKQT